MNEFCTLDVRLDEDQVLTVALNRPENRNLIDGAMVGEIIGAFRDAGRDPRVRVVVLRSHGPVFSDGADPRWMAGMAQASRADNLLDAKNLAYLFESIDACPRPVVAAVHGAVVGEAMGLISACDVVIASAETTFQMPELRYGIVPACVAPFLIAKIGQSHARYVMLTGREIDAVRAREIRLVHDIVPSPRDLDRAVSAVTTDILKGAPEAHKQADKLIRRLTFHGHSILTSDTMEDVATCLAESRASEEAREGLLADCEGRPPRWAK